MDVKRRKDKEENLFMLYGSNAEFHGVLPDIISLPNSYRYISNAKNTMSQAVTLIHSITLNIYIAPL